MPRPVAGATPVFTFSRSAYAGIVKWQEEEEPKPKDTRTAGAEMRQEEEEEKPVPEDTKTGEIFQPETVYKATVTLTPLTGHYFPIGPVMVEHLGSVSREDEEPSPEASTDGTWTVDILFPKTGKIVVSDLNMTSKIPMPVFDTEPQMPQTEEKWEGKGQEELQYYIKTIEWSEANGAFVISFHYEKEYTATVTMETKPGYTFTSALGEKFFHWDAKNPPKPKNGPALEGNELTLEIEFSYPLINRPFAGNFANKVDSVIDVLSNEKGESRITLNLAKKTDPEVVEFGSEYDFGEEGLVLEKGVTSPAKVTINGGGRVIDLTGTPSGTPLITVGDGVELTLKNITFKGLTKSDSDRANDSEDNTAHLIVIKGGGTLIMGMGSVLRDNSISCVKEEGNGRLTMQGGEIRDNTP
jgi:hypothetical protein